VAVKQEPEQARAKRPYASSRRSEHAAQTRAAILDAASQLFAARGWSATGMRDVASTAGVAVETVYANFGSKPELLRAALDVAVVGDSEPVELRERPMFTALARGARAERARAAARLVREINERMHGVGRALREAAAGDAELATYLHEGEERRRLNVDEGAGLVAGRPVTETERDGLWAVLSMEVYDLLVYRAGWSADSYEEWLGATIIRLLASAEEQQ
jgi:AcrR family transcriptional regulator